MEIVLLIIGLYLFDGGIIRKFGAIGLFINDMVLSYSNQVYVSDASKNPSNAFLFFTPQIQQSWVIMLAILILITLSWTFISLARLIKYSSTNKLSLTQILEELV